MFFQFLTDHEASLGSLLAVAFNVTINRLVPVLLKLQRLCGEVKSGEMVAVLGV